jgi:phage protein D
MAVASTQAPLVPDFDIEINGSPLPRESKVHVMEVKVDDDVSLPGMFTMVLTASDDQQEEIPWIDDEDLFAIGNPVVVKMGYRDDLEMLISAEITGLEPEFTFDRLPSLTVRGYDLSHRLLRGRKTRTFIQQKDSDIASQIAGDAGLTGQVEDSQVVHDYVFQANQTDMAFLQHRARRIRYEMVVVEKDLFFQPVSNADSEIMTLTLSDDLLEFYPRMSSVSQVSEVSVRGWNPADKQEIVGQAGSGDEVSTMGGQNSGADIVADSFGTAAGILTDDPVMTQAEADQIAKARFNHALLELINGEGICLGRTDLRSGKIVNIDGVGSRFSGSYYVVSAVHHYTITDGYYTHFTVRRNAL